jgi:hypothetical protein
MTHLMSCSLFYFRSQFRSQDVPNTLTTDSDDRLIESLTEWDHVASDCDTDQNRRTDKVATHVPCLSKRSYSRVKKMARACKTLLKQGRRRRLIRLSSLAEARHSSEPLRLDQPPPKVF